MRSQLRVYTALCLRSSGAEPVPHDTPPRTQQLNSTGLSRLSSSLSEAGRVSQCESFPPSCWHLAAHVHTGITASPSGTCILFVVSSPFPVRLQTAVSLHMASGCGFITLLLFPKTHLVLEP